MENRKYTFVVNFTGFLMVYLVNGYDVSSSPCSDFASDFAMTLPAKSLQKRKTPAW
jgi:hypothetical protein